MPKLRIGIIGGGIGGVAAAVALHQAGIEPIVYERAPEIREVGAGMMLWPNATRVLKGMGLLESVLKCSGPSTNFLVRANSGKLLMNLGLGKFEVPSVCIRRSDLLSVLLAALPPSCIHLGHKFKQLKQTRNNVIVSFDGGLESEFGALIGADGIRSQVRGELFGPSEPVYRGYMVWRGVARYDGRAIWPGTNSETWGAGKRFGILNIGNGYYTWYATSNVSQDHVDAPCGRKREVQNAFSGWHDPIGELIEATNEERIVKNGAYDRTPLHRFGKGLVTLLGDAAHPCTPNLGQAGCMALEDAAVLTKCVQQEATITMAFRRYESLRGSRTRHVQQRSRLMGEIGQWESRLFVTARRVVTRLLPAAPFERNLRRMYSYDA